MQAFVRALLFYVVLTNGTILEYSQPIERVIIPPANGQFVIIQDNSQRTSQIVNSDLIAGIFVNKEDAQRMAAQTPE